MSHQFKPGDLALTLVAIPGKIEAGACVEVYRVYAPGDRFEMPRGPVEAAQEIVAVAWSGRKFGYAPSQLMPLRGDFEPEQLKSKEAEPCA
ncbi:hypothetical protein IRZ70_11615 [Pseudomonas monteilii]|nr:hypothetical protein [Pseudomonas monteilii]